MHRVENKTLPSIFLTKFCKTFHAYPLFGTQLFNTYLETEKK